MSIRKYNILLRVSIGYQGCFFFLESYIGVARGFLEYYILSNNSEGSNMIEVGVVLLVN